MLFVCLGNVCRSPMAQGAFLAAAARCGLECHADSVGTAAYHLGSPPDPRAVAVALAHGVTISDQSARQIARDDYFRFHHIIALDRANLEEIKTRAPRGATARFSMLLDAVDGRQGEPVPDPYYGTEADFQRAWDLITEGVEALTANLLAQNVRVQS